MSRGARAAAAMVAVLAAAGAVLALPGLVRLRVWPTSTPVPPDLVRVTPVALAPETTACVAPVTVEPLTGAATFTVRGASPPLRVTVAAGAYRAAVRVPGGYPPGRPLVVGLPAPRGVAAGRLCVRNAGRAAARLDGTASLRRATTTVAGRSAGADLALTMVEARRRSMSERVGAVLRRAAAFRPFGPAVLGVALLALLLCMLVGLPWALARAAGDDAAGRGRPG